MSGYIIRYICAFFFITAKIKRNVAVWARGRDSVILELFIKRCYESEISDLIKQMISHIAYSKSAGFIPYIPETDDGYKFSGWQSQHRSVNSPLKAVQ